MADQSNFTIYRRNARLRPPSLITIGRLTLSVLVLTALVIEPQAHTQFPSVGPSPPRHQASESTLRQTCIPRRSPTLCTSMKMSGTARTLFPPHSGLRPAT